ncbi:Anthranilate phosphoribosyltransferase [Buchnera aphidicola (Cinara kochiana kochiana)]|uniref:Anthranilate phosphoribosyltransferase n=1 Tax=Buchnera aphidicola (Cinara kochiana kochiana) TaxID=2518976 RepID=A0A451D5J8_9GAMM|nr:anthranilate phosphoribosyltransferase [Buchnera aphidicola]VFP81098.1 Anthranilate phosphoribosyltransferase [Buchnera aphidicola (Cinara kochiana kochiana)]
MKKILKKIYNGKYLNELESYTLFESIFKKKINNMQIAAVLAILSSRTETYEEIIGARKFLIQQMPLFPKSHGYISDIVGTGGDQQNSFNISTVSAIVSACYGIKIAKICNIGSSSQLGSANLLQQLNINTNITPKQSKQCLDKMNICFLLANNYLSDFKKISKIRSLLQTKTIFNILGPLLNPAQPTYALIGVYKPQLMLTYARILSYLLYKRAIIVHSSGIDEATLHSNTTIVELNNKQIKEYELSPEDFGLKKYHKNYIIKKSKLENYLETIKLFKGKGEPVYTQTIAMNVSLLMKVLGNNDIRKNTSDILNFINTGQVYKFVLKLSKLCKLFN